jgi:hypothetical protein
VIKEKANNTEGRHRIIGRPRKDGNKPRADGMVTLNIKIPFALHHLIRVYAAEHDMTIAAATTEICMQTLAKDDKEAREAVLSAFSVG